MIGGHKGAVKDIKVGDIDGNGKPDLAVVNSGSSDISVLRNTSVSGSISFAVKVDFGTGAQPWDVVLGDIDGDGKMDLSAASINSSCLSVLQNAVGLPTVVDKTDSGSNGIELFPNPASSFVTLKVKDNANNDLSYRLYNSSGTLLLEKKLEGNETIIQLETFSSATYILKIVQTSSSPAKELKTFKLIKY